MMPGSYPLEEGPCQQVPEQDQSWNRVREIEECVWVRVFV